ncbi:hypothetical protein PR202_ga05413 [Eleusine coracana subsp. coracana]|uniref:DUF1618 domain-containing protein n=1 Tax=Eleusine coracana subsp. coracana TaxID=191504 RepID=A0AAV5BVE6_ELECO|nr:hypothetical protein PR202_ga04960 [Eleusine coracana subsp. coracana]GJM89244.1 hypothetical protein PR202_ga05413 [Eleusine coracana subsp. coracana]
MFRLPDIDGTKNAASGQKLGLLTRSKRPNGPPDRYAVAEITEEDHEGEGRSFVMRRFLSQTGEWEDQAGLRSPLPLAHRLNVHEVLNFAGRLWWVDLSWGAVSADPFSDRPELRFVELPSGSVTEPMAVPGRFRRMGISEGKLRYVEVSKKEPFYLSLFSLSDDGSSWKQERHVALHHCWKNHGNTSEESAPRISAIDPLNASAIHVTTGDIAFAVDLDKEKAFGFSMLGEGEGYSSRFSGFISCLLPSWLGSSRIPSAGTLSSNKTNVKSKTLSDILVRADRDRKN